MFTNPFGMEFVLVPKGKSWIGGGGGKPGDKEVQIKEDFYLGKYEVTQDEWEKVMGATPSNFARVGGGKEAVKDIPDAELKRFPVEQIS
jgi:formylglycine-generating enzyme required for sulfatase activity